MTDEERALEIAARVAGWTLPSLAKRLGQRATENAIAGLEEHLAPHIAAALAAARAEALEDAAKLAERVYGELRLEFLLRMADEIRALAAQSSPEAAE